MFKLIPILMVAAAAAALAGVRCDPHYASGAPLPYGQPSPPAGYHHQGAPLPYGVMAPPPSPHHMAGAANPNAYYPHAPGSVRASLKNRIYDVKNSPRVAKALNSWKPVVGSAARLAAPMLSKAAPLYDKAAGWSRSHGAGGAHHAAPLHGQYPAVHAPSPSAYGAPPAYGAAAPVKHY